MRSQKEDLQIIYGRNPIMDAIAAGKKFERIYVRDTLTGEVEKEIRHICKEKDIVLKKVPQIKLDKLSRNRNHQGVLGIGAIIDYQELDQIIPHLYENGIPPIFLLLDNVQDTRNIGGIARSAEALGAQCIILSGKQTGMITHDSIKTSAGALTRIHVCKEKNTIKTMEQLQANGITCVGTSLDATTSLYDTELQSPICIVMGSEGEGLHRTVEGACDLLVKIPQAGQTESLNVSVAAGILLYQLGHSMAKHPS